MNQHTERAFAAVAPDAGIFANRALAEEASAEGRYEVTGYTPKAGKLAECLAVQAQIENLRGLGRIGRLSRAMQGRFGSHLEEAAKLEQSMHRDLMDVAWKDEIKNLVTTVGKNYLLDSFLAGSSYTATWYLGLISSSSYSAVAVGDTQASHAGWLEAGGTNAPQYSQAARPTAAWSAASGGSKALSAALTYTIATTGGTIKGAFLTSIATKDGTTGTLYSAGLFTGGDKVVSVGDSLAVSYTASV